MARGALAGALACWLAIAAAGCGGVGSGESRPEAGKRTVTILSLLPESSSSDKRDVDAMEAGIEAAIQARGGRAGGFSVRYLRADSTDPSLGTEAECADIASKYANNQNIVGVIGPLTDGCAAQLVPTFDQADVSVVSATVNSPVLTHEVEFPLGQPGCFLSANRFNMTGCSPTDFYPSGIPNHATVTATVDSQGPVAAALFDQLGARRVYVLNPYGEDPWILGTFLAEAKRRRLDILGIGKQGIYRVPKKEVARQVARVLAARPDAIYLVYVWEADPARRDEGLAPVLKAIRQKGFGGPIVGSFWFQTGRLLVVAPEAAAGMYFTSVRLPLAALPPEAARFARGLGLEGRYALDAVYAAEAANVLLDAIAASDGSRAGVRAALFRVARDGLLGPIRIDENGDVRPQRIAVFQAGQGEMAYRQTMIVGPVR